ncbi:MAG: serine/threonine-protein kinase, partial [Planctomycetota bacterium]
MLDEASGSDLDLRKEVEDLLAYHTKRSLSWHGEDVVLAPLPPSERHETGKVLAGRYQIVAPLGRGGMGEVYRAEDLTLGVPVALKFLRDGGPLHREKLLNEVRLAREVTHPAVCRVFDIAEADGHSFVTMEYIDGEDLASQLRRIGRLPTAKVLELAPEICAGLAAAHEHGVLHRDLKPANVMLDASGHARIVDFGIAIREGVPDLVLVGTPAYMAPEQLVPGREVTEQTDLYALGLLLYEIA